MQIQIFIKEQEDVSGFPSVAVSDYKSETKLYRIYNPMAKSRTLGLPSMLAGLSPSLLGMGAAMEIHPQSERERDGERPLCLPHLRAERGSWSHPSQGHALHSHDTGGVGNMAER